MPGGSSSSLRYVNGISNISTIIDSHIRRLTHEHNTPMPLADIAYQHLITARAINNTMKAEGRDVFDPLDWSAIIAGTRVAAGLDAFDSSKVRSASIRPSVRNSIDCHSTRPS